MQNKNDAKKTIDCGYYKTVLRAKQPKVNLKQAILNCKSNAIITAIKAASPSLGTIRTEVNAKEIAQAMERPPAEVIALAAEHGLKLSA